MADEPSHSLEVLERRWQLGKTPQTGLRLAELYRRRDDLPSAIEALKSGLEVYPNHTASRVALSRYLIDGERFEEAIAHLEQIVALDPAHLVANKLLVGAYAGVGRVEDGRDKLAIYEMMAEGDADIESLHDLLEAAESRSDALQTASPARDSTVEDKSEAPTVQAPYVEAWAEPASTSFEPEPGIAAEPVPEGVAEPSEAPLEPRAAADSDRAEVDDSSEPFGALPLPSPPGPAAPTQADSNGGEEPFGGAFEPAVFAPGPAQLDDEVFSFADAEPEPAPEAEPEPAPAAADAGAQRSAHASAPAQERGSSITLGRLYLEQGLSERALEVFEDVLVHDPDNEVARQELEARRKGGAHSSSGAARNEGAPPDGDLFAAKPAADLVSRKKAALIDYRARLRGAIAARR